tara:strand:+ start:15743 stop:16414 length:672 start_codon:yes stop_codon:yes gene_type:complete
MITTLTKESTTETMCQTLLKDGVFKIENYLTGETLQGLHDDILNRCENEAGHYEFGRNYRGENISTFPKDGAIFKVYDEKWMRVLHEAYTGHTNDYGMNVFATHDYKFDGELARNGWLHFDRHWRLKFFIYLTDVDKSSGAFNCSVGSRTLGGQLRTNAWGAKNYEGVKNRIDLDYPELLEKWPCEPVEAPAGTLIVFDTDTFHKGGKCDEGKERLIVRLHCG